MEAFLFSGDFAFDVLHHDSFELSVAVSLSNIFSLVIIDFPFANRQLHLDLAIFPIKRERYQRMALDGSQSKQFTNF